MFPQETRNNTRGPRSIVSGNEAYCHSLCTLQLVDLLFLVRVPGDCSILQQGSDKSEVSLAFAGCGTVSEETEGTVGSLSDVVDVG